MNKISFKHITLKDNLELYKLSEYVEIPVSELIDKILVHLYKLEYILDTQEECGMLLIEILAIQHYEIRSFCQNIFNVWTPRLESYLNMIYVWGNYDCPDCGCQLEYPGLFNEVFGVCKNCGYERGAAYFPDDNRDDCINDLINKHFKYQNFN